MQTEPIDVEKVSLVIKGQTDGSPPNEIFAFVKYDNNNDNCLHGECYVRVDYIMEKITEIITKEIFKEFQQIKVKKVETNHELSEDKRNELRKMIQTKVIDNGDEDYKIKYDWLKNTATEEAYNKLRKALDDTNGKK